MNDLDDTLPPETVDTSSVMRCYALLSIGLVAALTPVYAVSSLGTLGLLIGVIWAYRLRKKHSHGGIIENHARWMIRTFWISSVYFLIALLISSSFVSANADSSAIENMTEALKAQTATPEEITAMIDAYNLTNRSLILWTSGLCFGPVLLYTLARFFVGYRLADAGHILPRPKTWLIR